MQREKKADIKARVASNHYPTIKYEPSRAHRLVNTVSGKQMVLYCDLCCQHFVWPGRAKRLQRDPSLVIAVQR